jgi:hypothetical protein
MEPVLQTQIFQIAVVSGLLVTWAAYYRLVLDPWLRKGGAQGGKPFPIFSAIGLLTITALGFLAITNDLANKDVPPPGGRPTSEVARKVIENPQQESSETLEEKTKRMLEENRESNQKAKDAFRELPPAKSDHQ